MSKQATSKLKPGQFVGNYEIIKLVGRGGMAEVYSASQPRIDRRVAIKVMLSDSEPTGHFAERFEQEARTLGMLEHPHILPIIEYGTDQNFNFIVMRLVE